MAATQRTLTLKSHKERKRLIGHCDHDPKPYVRERCALIIKVADGQSTPLGGLAWLAQTT